MKVYLAARYEERRAWAIDQLGSQCIKCGATEGLEFDHIDRAQKTIAVPKILLGAWGPLCVELAKCQLLCASCHLAKTHEEVSVPHGGGARGRRGCRCDLCRKKRNEYQKLWRRGKVGESRRAVGSSASS